MSPSALSLIVGGIAVISYFGLRLGIDFTGGSLTEVAYSTTLPDKAVLESEIANLNIGSFTVRESQDEVGRDGFWYEPKV